MLTVEQQAKRHLYTARLVLLQKVGHKHPLMGRVKLNGGLKSDQILRFHAVLSSLEDEVQQQSMILAKITGNEVHGRPAQQRLSEVLNNSRMPADPLKPCRKNAAKGEMGRRIMQEATSRNAQLESEMRGLSKVFDDCAILSDESEEETMFPLEIGAAL